MKKLSLVLSVLFLSFTTVNAQSNSEEIAIVQEAFGMEKKEVISSFISLDGENLTTFWEIYDEYESERKNNGKKLITSLEKYSNEYEKLDDASTKKLTKELISIRDNNNKILKKYYKKIDNKCDAKTATQFYQLESYFQSLVRLTVMESIPFVGEES